MNKQNETQTFRLIRGKLMLLFLLTIVGFSVSGCKKLSESPPGEQTAMAKGNRHGMITLSGVSTVELYPGPGSGAYQSDQYVVEVNDGLTWDTAYVYKLSGTKYNAGNLDLNFLTFGTSGNVLVRVTKLAGSISSVQIRPESYGISHSLSGSQVTFEMAQLQKVILKFDGSTDKQLQISADPLKPAVPAGATYYGPGIHSPGEIVMASNEVIYIDGGAWVKGRINAKNAGNAKIIGPGVLSGEDYAWSSIHSLPNWQDYTMVRCVGSTRTTTQTEVIGITIVKAPMHHINMMPLNASLVANVKCLTPWNINTDGIHSSSASVTVRNNFMFNNDDGMYCEYNRAGPVNFYQNTIYNSGDAGSPIVLGLGWSKNTDYPQLCHVYDCDIIADFPIASRRFFEARGEENNGDVRNILMENIRVKCYVAGWKPMWLRYTSATSSNYRDITFKDIYISTPDTVKSIISGYSATSRIYNLNLLNFQINGNVVTQSNQSTYFTTSAFASGIIFGNPLIGNGGFEGGTGSWTAYGPSSISSVTMAYNERNGGIKACKVSARSNASTGPQQDVKSLLLAKGAGNYQVEAMFRASASNQNLHWLIRTNDSSGNHWFGLPAVTATNSSWAKNAGTVNITWTGTLNSAIIYTEGAAGTEDYYVDDIVIKK